MVRWKWLQGLALSLATTTVVLLLAEGALRLAFRASMDLSMEMWKYAVQLKQSVADPDLAFVHRPGLRAHLMGVDVELNSHGMRDHEFTRDKPAGVYRVLVLGDSTAFGWGVPQDQTAAKQLERLLNEHATPERRFEVLNAGVGNYGTVQELAFYERFGRALQADLVILLYFINDAEPVPSESQMPFLRSSYLAAFVKSRLDSLLHRAGLRPSWRAYYASLYLDSSPSFGATKDALLRLAAATRRDGAQLLVALLPELHDLEDYPFTEAHAKVGDVLASAGVHVLELIDGLRTPEPEATWWVTPTDAHPNAKANARIAVSLRDWTLR